MKNRNKLLILSLLFVYHFGIAQSILKGKVLDSGGSPVIGAAAIVYQNNIQVKGVTSDFDGNYMFTGLKTGVYDLEFRSLGLEKTRMTGIHLMKDTTLIVDVKMAENATIEDEICIKEYKVPLIDFDQSSSGKVVTAEAISKSPLKNIRALAATSAGISHNRKKNSSKRGSHNNKVDGLRIGEKEGNPIKYNENINPEKDNYEAFEENVFFDPIDNPLSTLSIDVDRASYSNIRRFLLAGQLPPKESVRIEEMINYFDYDFARPNNENSRPFQTNSTIVKCPWNSEHQLLHISLQGRKIEKENLPPSNFVFLIDVSGSMNEANKLPLLISSFQLLVRQLNKKDKVAIVVYAGAAGCVLESTAGDEKSVILDALNKLRAGGSTAGAAGIHLAYEIAEKNFIKEGNNRIILATDGDFNVGTSNDNELISLIEEKRKSDVFLSILAFGTGNYKDSKMQKIADAGNGNHSYIDNLLEAKKVFMNEFAGTLYTIAKDVKIQIEFNPSVVQNYRMVGYENRVLEAKDFNNDTKDAGEMGAGHSVTIIYEIIPIGVKSTFINTIDHLKYQENPMIKSNSNNLELATIKYRYKEPTGKKSIKSEEIIFNNIIDSINVPADIFWAINVAEFGMLLRKSDFIEQGRFPALIKNIDLSLAVKKDKYREEFKDLVEIAYSLMPENLTDSSQSSNLTTPK